MIYSLAFKRLIITSFVNSSRGADTNGSLDACDKSTEYCGAPSTLCISS